LQHNFKVKTISKISGISADVLSACKKDNRKAIKFLYAYCFEKLMPVCYQYYNNEEDAQSALNVGFMKILKGLETIEESVVNFNAWSKRIMINTLIDEYRKKKSYSTLISVKASDYELDLEAYQTDNEAESTMGYESILNLVHQLPETTKRVFIFYVIDGYNHREIGDLIGISEGTSKWHLSSARKTLRQKLELIETYNQRMVI
jgi:RNA polymerase sigma-70 factor (ECF subfamily)